MKLTILAGCSSAALVLTVGLAAADKQQFGDFDKNADKNVTVEEFGAGLDRAKVYKRFDTNGDGNIDVAECNSGLKTADICDSWVKWDANGDGKVDNPEFNTGLYGHYNNDADASTMNQAEFDAGGNIISSD
jgi:hypothetical protein